MGGREAMSRAAMPNALARRWKLFWRADVEWR
jgi:hypothetical protein